MDFGLGINILSYITAAQAVSALFLYILLYVLFTYGFIKWDQVRGGPNQGDTQVGFKVIIFALVLVTLFFGSVGVFLTVDYLLAGAKGNIKPALAIALACGVSFVTLFLLFLNSSNVRQYRTAERMFWGALGLGAFMLFLMALIAFFIFAFEGFDGWRTFGSKFFTGTVIYGGIGWFALYKLGSLSGWTPSQGQFIPAGPPPGQGGYGGPGGQSGHYAPQQSNPTVGYPASGGPPPAGAPPASGYPPAGGYGGQGGMPPGGYGGQGGGGVPPAGGGPPPAQY